MTRAQIKNRPHGTSRGRLMQLVAILALFSLMNGVAWAYWSAGSIAGGGGTSAATAVNQGATPTASRAGHTITVSWAVTTLTTGEAVTGYKIKRYDAGTAVAQTILAACAGTIVALTCTENSVPDGSWEYTVTPIFATNWQGRESAKSSAVTLTTPTLTLTPAILKPGTTLTGTAAAFVGGETLRYRLDNPTSGTILTGSLAGSATPATVPGGGGGAAVVTVPVGTSEGAHTVYAVSSPRGDTAAVAIVVDGTAPPPPVLTSTPTAVSGDAVMFAYTESEPSAAVECRLDSDAFVPCASPVDYTGLAAGSHTFQARASDTAGNVSASTSYPWTVNLSTPTMEISFPEMGGVYNDSGFNTGCGTAGVGDLCGMADDDGGVTAVALSVRRLSTGLYWNGASFSAGVETWPPAAGTADWTYNLLASAFPEGDYTLRGRATDGGNFGYEAHTFTVDRTAPAAPTLTTVPPATSGPTATFAFTTADPTAVFECRLDGAAWTSCSSPQPYSGLSNGSHTVDVQAVDSAANRSISASTTWTVDATAPTAAMTFPATTAYNLSGWAAGCGTPATGDVCGTAGDIGSALTAVDVSIRQASTGTYWNGSSFNLSSETWLRASGTASWSYLFDGASFPADGSYTVRWRATDAVGNSSTGGVDLTLDTDAPPAPQFTLTPENPSGDHVHFNFTDVEPGTGFQCQMDAGAWATCVGITHNEGMAAGLHTYGVRATDAAGNVSAPVSYTWTVDNSLPIVAISFPVSSGRYTNTTYDTGCGTPTGDICGWASDTQSDLTEVALSIRRVGTSLYWNGASFSSATEVFLPATGTASWSYAMAATSFPADDNYTLRARATRYYGQFSIYTETITIDRTAPLAPTITSGPSGTTGGGGPFSFTFTGEAGAGFECSLDAGTWAACTSPKTYGALTSGLHTFDVLAVDGAGNLGAPTRRTWTVDATPPTVGTTFPVAGAGYNNASWKLGCAAATDELCGTASDPGGTVASIGVAVRRTSTGLYWNGTAFGAAAPTWLPATGTASWSLPFAATAFPAEGTYVLSARATDATGNVSTPTDTTFTIDRTGPSAAALSAVNKGATARTIETGDQLILTFTEAIAPSSLIAGWNGTGTQNITVRQANNTNDALTFYNALNTTRLPLGVVQMKQGGYTSGAVVWGATGTRSTIALSGATLTITFGTPDVPARVTTATLAANMNWNPRTSVVAGTGITDLIGNLGTTTGRAESDTDNDF